MINLIVMTICAMLGPLLVVWSCSIYCPFLLCESYWLTVPRCIYKQCEFRNKCIPGRACGTGLGAFAQRVYSTVLHAHAVKRIDGFLRFFLRRSPAANPVLRRDFARSDI